LKHVLKRLEHVSVNSLSENLDFFLFNGFFSVLRHCATSALVQEAGVCPEVKIARTWTNATIDQEFAELACVKTKSEVTTVYAKAAF